MGVKYAKIKNWKISYKISAIIITTTFISLFFALSGIVAYDHSVRKSILAQELLVLSAVTAQRSTAALQFFDQRAAKENLEALKIHTIIQSACIYDGHGQIFSFMINRKRFNPGGSAHCIQDVSSPGVYFSEDVLEVITSIQLKGVSIGHIYIQASLRETIDRLQHSIAVSVLIMMASLLVSLVLIIPVQQKLIKPIIDLRDLAKTISRNKDYSVRANIEQRDEIGDTAAAFDMMIATIEESNKELHRLAFYDTLTELGNRRKFMKDLELLLVKTRYGKQQCALVFIDVDKFKQINDTYGHDAGDEVLVSLATCLKEKLPENATAYRLGGDELTIIIKGIDDKESVIATLDTLQEGVKKPLDISGHIIQLTVSMGVAMSSGFDSPFSIMKRADLAVYESKKRGRNCYHFADEFMHGD